MFSKRIGLAGLLLAIGAGAAGCTDGYGYSGVSVGYGPSYYGGGYGDYYANPYGYGDPYGYGSSYYGWYGDYYYPGSGIYVYDRYQRPYRWNDDQRRYWQSRQGDHHDGGTHWDGFNRSGNPGDRNRYQAPGGTRDDGRWRDYQRQNATPGNGYRTPDGSSWRRDHSSSATGSTDRQPSNGANWRQSRPSMTPGATSSIDHPSMGSHVRNGAGPNANFRPSVTGVPRTQPTP